MAVAAPFPAAAVPSVELTVRGIIPPSCEILSNVSGLDLGNISRAGRETADVSFSCNTPFVVNLSSENGRLERTAQRTAGNFQNALDYQASLRVPLDNGRVLRIRECDSEELLNGGACANASSESQTAINKTASLAVKWSDSIEPLLAGDYSDVITIRVEFAP
ncbi:hypothetical protein [Parasphingopyxis sp.]|uniref:hypothetical protein n=1 Tax=Parasphingopyxis sp. TaxID=1920299 RepID=UPI0026290A6B|nr:hypothetical protein [Parasphingopyxis sp.]